MGRQVHKFHGSPERFEVVADFVLDRYGRKIKYIADVAGGQGMLTKLLNKKNYEAEVIDPRGWTLRSVPSRQEEYNHEFATYYDLVIGLHPDEALREVVLSAKVRPVVLIPCCNFWDDTRRLGREALLEEVQEYYDTHGIKYEKIIFDFKGPKNIGLVSEPK